MKKEELSALLQRNYTQFIQLIAEISNADFCYAPEGKWSAGQQLDHLVKSVSPVNMAMGLPKFIPKLLFGTANRPSKSYEALVEKYALKLKEGGRATGRFVPKTVTPTQKDDLTKQLSFLVKRLCRKTEKQTEEALDIFILPHPLLGKLTLREMLYFTAYHVEHHRQLVLRGLENR
jgi:hypothetical protein